jgi:hypothetical protein
VPAIVGTLTLAIALSSHAAGARPVAIGLQATYPMQCGWPGPTIDVVFPVAERLRARFLPSSILVDGKPPTAVSRSGRTVELSIARPGDVLCDAIAPGTAHVLFTRTAGFGNPVRTGTYAIAVTHGRSTVRGSFRMR